MTLANWPIVAIDFSIESLYKFALAAPVVGGAFVVAILMGTDVRALLADGLISAADQVLASLGHAPSALWAFLIAATAVGIGGAILMFVVKAGTLAVIVEADGQASEIQRAPISHRALGEARAYSSRSVFLAIRHYRARAVRLGALLSACYLGLAGTYVVAITYGSRHVAASPIRFAWPLFVLLATVGAVLCLAAVNFLFDLTRVVLTTEDCGVRAACVRVGRFLVADARQVLGIFGVMGLVLLMATAAALTATAALTLVAWVPLAGFIVIPLQAAFWVVRGLLFQFMGIMTIAAYQTQYRRFAEPSRPATPFRWREL